MKAIVLKRREYREYDQIVSLFTELSGKVELLTTGIKKIVSKNSGNLLVGSIVDIEIAKGKEINHLTKVQSINILRKSREDLSKSIAIKYISELIDRVTKVEERDESIFLFLQQALEFIEQTDQLNKSFIYGFVIKLFIILGFSPVINNCVSCQSVKHINNFSVVNGGLICTNCCSNENEKTHIYKINEQQKAYFVVLLQENWDVINTLKENKQIFKLIKHYITFHSESNIQTI